MALAAAQTTHVEGPSLAGALSQLIAAANQGSIGDGILKAVVHQALVHMQKVSKV